MSLRIIANLQGPRTARRCAIQCAQRSFRPITRREWRRARRDGRAGLAVEDRVRVIVAAAAVVREKGTLNNWSLTITRGVAPPPLVAASLPATPTAAMLRSSSLAPIVQEAIARWQATGLTPAQLSALANVKVQIADLGGTTLGLAAGNTITLDDNAADWGWFVDRTPRRDSEFRLKGNQGEQGRIDLLTAIVTRWATCWASTTTTAA